MTEEGIQQREEGGDLGGTMRLGAYEAKLAGNSHTSAMYGGVTSISERHRHRYEVNSAYIEPLERQGLVFAGMSPDGLLPEIVERPDHPWFVGVQFTRNSSRSRSIRIRCLQASSQRRWNNRGSSSGLPTLIRQRENLL